MKTRGTVFVLFFAAFIINSCDETGILTDVQKIAALRNVTIEYNNLTYEIGLPAGATSGKSLAELLLEDSASFKNPENYSISIIAELIADNTKPDAEDAKFDGAEADVIMDTLTSNPIKMETDGFEVKKGTTHPFDLETTINLKTHRKAGLYIFRQTVDGNDLATTTKPRLLYTVGTQSGTIDGPELKQDIPTRASDETKEFLRQLLDSGIFDE
ncbi:MAG: hypothetical protein JXA77_04590 [Bacteroidales bacterium]|nr:hypothetical protein [Bacteroidales bacterium]MBN2820090.1 hypothetical protein [Bacteroidales bacterium]